MIHLGFSKAYIQHLRYVRAVWRRGGGGDKTLFTTENIDVICIISHFQTNYSGDLGLTSAKDRYLAPLNLARVLKYGVQGVGVGVWN